MDRQDAAAEMTRLIVRIEEIAKDDLDVRAIEPLLTQLVDLFRAEAEHREILSNKMLALAQRSKPGEYRALFGPGQREIIEYTMYALRWPEVARCLERMRDTHPDVSTRRMAAGCLAAFQDDWGGRDIYESLG